MKSIVLFCSVCTIDFFPPVCPRSSVNFIPYTTQELQTPARPPQMLARPLRFQPNRRNYQALPDAGAMGTDKVFVGEAAPLAAAAASLPSSANAAAFCLFVVVSDCFPTPPRPGQARRTAADSRPRRRCSSSSTLTARRRRSLLFPLPISPCRSPLPLLPLSSYSSPSSRFRPLSSLCCAAACYPPAGRAAEGRRDGNAPRRAQPTLRVQGREQSGGAARPEGEAQESAGAR